MTMTQEELKIILDKHQKWLSVEEDGARADLSRANLSDADLSDADLSDADLSDADLSDANLSDADLRYADLSFADLDHSCLPLWCGSLHAHFDDRQIIQIVYHAVRAGLGSPNVSDEIKTELRMVAGLANRFHRVDECGRIEEVSQ